MLKAIGITNVSPARYQDLQNMVDEFLHPVFEANMKLIQVLIDQLSGLKTINKAKMEELKQKLKEDNLTFPCQDEKFDELLVKFNGWC